MGLFKRKRMHEAVLRRLGLPAQSKHDEAKDKHVRYLVWRMNEEFTRAGYDVTIRRIA